MCTLKKVFDEQQNKSQAQEICFKGFNKKTMTCYATNQVVWCWFQLVYKSTKYIVKDYFSILSGLQYDEANELVIENLTGYSITKNYYSRKEDSGMS